MRPSPSSSSLPQPSGCSSHLSKRKQTYAFRQSPWSVATYPPARARRYSSHRCSTPLSSLTRDVGGTALVSVGHPCVARNSEVPRGGKSLVHAASSGAAEPTQEATVPTGKLLLLSALVVALGVANRLLLKIALVPMGSYAFAMSLLQCFGYVIVYNAILRSRIRSGIVTQPMRDTPIAPFVLVGLLEGVTNVAQTYLAIHLPGALIPLLSQSGVIWQLALSAVLLGRRYSVRQVVSALIVVAGVVLAGIPARGVPAGAAHPYDVVAYVGTFSFIALDVLLKEKIFRDAKQRIGSALDIFVVNSRGSLWQAIFVFLSLPVLTNLKGLSFNEIPAYFVQGMECLMGQVPPGSVGVDPTGAPLLPILYILVNLSFNISALYVLRMAGSVHTSLVMSSVLPLTVLAFSFPLPLLGQPAPLGPFFGIGFVVLMVGMVLFNSAKRQPA